MKPWVDHGGTVAKKAVDLGGQGRPPRIVFIDDEPVAGEVVEFFIQQSVRDVTLLRFENRDTAWGELQRADPDLLITDLNNDNIPGRTEYLGMSGWKLLGLLRRRKVKYPVLVVSGCLSMPKRESVAREFAGPELNVSFMTKPFTGEFFQQEVSRLLNGGEHCGRRFPKGKL